MEAVEQVTITLLPGGRVSRRDAAAFLGRKPKTLAMWALEGKGPRPILSGGRAFYSFDDVKVFAGIEPEPLAA